MKVNRSAFVLTFAVVALTVGASTQGESSQLDDKEVPINHLREKRALQKKKEGKKSEAVSLPPSKAPVPPSIAPEPAPQAPALESAALPVKCAEEGQQCLTPSVGGGGKSVRTPCCGGTDKIPPLKCTIEKIPGEIKHTVTCQKRETSDLKKEDRHFDKELKENLCNELGTVLDRHYENIKATLDKLNLTSTNSTGLNLQVDALCKNKDRSDPGLRDIVAYARWDYVQKCKQGDVAKCEYELVKAIDDGENLYRRAVYEGRIIKGGDKGSNEDIIEQAEVLYVRDSMEKQAEYESIGWNVELDCDPIEPSPYLYKPFPYNPRHLGNLCGQYGYASYID